MSTVSKYVFGYNTHGVQTRNGEMVAPLRTDGLKYHAKEKYHPLRHRPNAPKISAKCRKGEHYFSCAILNCLCPCHANEKAA